VRILLCVLILHCALATAVAAESVVELTPGPDVVEVKIDGEPFAVYHFGDDLPKPFFSPVYGPEEIVLSRPLEKPKDHPHHKGIWVSVDEVNGVDFWAEKGKIDNVSVELLAAAGNPALLKVVNHWLGSDGAPVVTETTVIGIHANRLLTYDITFTAGAAPVTFGDTKEGLFGFRMVDPLREREGGHVVNAEGLEGTAACWGKNSNWVDYYGEVEGQTVGVAIFDHPQNFRPSRYHVRDYGLFSISPFGEGAYTSGQKPADEPVVMPGASLRLRYGIYFHAGDTAAGDVAGVYKRYLESGGL
jgi:hypothetical protein